MAQRRYDEEDFSSTIIIIIITVVITDDVVVVIIVFVLSIIIIIIVVYLSCDIMSLNVEIALAPNLVNGNDGEKTFRVICQPFCRLSCNIEARGRLLVIHCTTQTLK